MTTDNRIPGFLSARDAAPPYKHVPKQALPSEPEPEVETETPVDAHMTGSIVLADVAAGFSEEFIAEQLARPVPKERRETGPIIDLGLRQPEDAPPAPGAEATAALDAHIARIREAQQRIAAIDERQAQQAAVDAIAPVMPVIASRRPIVPRQPAPAGRPARRHLAQEMRPVKPEPADLAPAVTGWRRVVGWFWPPLRGAA